MKRSDDTGQVYVRAAYHVCGLDICNWGGIYMKEDKHRIWTPLQHAIYLL